ncbi:hypothetical protein [Anatilimnocola floriformis]|uniref:hypothetical protein n=1 Tax=Anatilimnocola floriformis TaxID=2948575 RepID=UPI0020C2578B|nr:hypothetical protein [Anatilimnocola floriformis]
MYDNDRSEIKHRHYLSLASLPFWCSALLLWATLIAIVATSNFGLSGAFVASFSLIAATAAIARLLRLNANRFALSAFLAGLILTGSLFLIALLANSEWVG